MNTRGMNIDTLTMISIIYMSTLMRYQRTMIIRTCMSIIQSHIHMTTHQSCITDTHIEGGRGESFRSLISHSDNSKPVSLGYTEKRLRELTKKKSLLLA